MTTNWSFGKEQMEIEEKTKELKDLLAYMKAGGNPKDSIFSAKKQ